MSVTYLDNAGEKNYCAKLEFVLGIARTEGHGRCLEKGFNKVSDISCEACICLSVTHPIRVLDKDAGNGVLCSIDMPVSASCQHGLWTLDN